MLEELINKYVRVNVSSLTLNTSVKYTGTIVNVNNECRMLKMLVDSKKQTAITKASSDIVYINLDFVSYIEVLN